MIALKKLSGYKIWKVLFLAAALLTLFSSFAFAAKKAEPTKVYFASIDGAVGAPLEEYIGAVFGKIKDDGNKILVIKINTPGGLVESMSQIVSRISEADYPVVAWVSPSGGRAASAGAFIVLSAHVAVMAPGTNMGAAHPVTSGGKNLDDSELDRKITNDLMAKMRSMAQERGRDVKAAESMVRKSVSFTAREALDKKLIDFIAADENELFAKLDGRTVNVKDKQVKISLAEKTVERIEVPWRLRILELISRPDIAYLAFIAGIFLILIELKSPGGFIFGTTGAILLLMASYGFRVLPVNYAGMALLAGGIIVIVTDLVIGGIGIISTAGVGAMLLGGLMLFRAPGGELLRVSNTFIIVTTLIIAAIFFIILRLVFKALRSRPSSGREGMVGGKGFVTGVSNGVYMALIFGEYWRVIPDDGEVTLSVGDEVEVVRVESMNLYVKLLKNDGR